MRTLNTPAVLGAIMGVAAAMMLVTSPVVVLLIMAFSLILDHAFNLNPKIEFWVAAAVTYAAYIGVVSGVVLILVARGKIKVAARRGI